MDAGTVEGWVGGLWVGGGGGGGITVLRQTIKPMLRQLRRTSRVRTARMLT